MTVMTMMMTMMIMIICIHHSTYAKAPKAQHEISKSPSSSSSSWSSSSRRWTSSRSSKLRETSVITWPVTWSGRRRHCRRVIPMPISFAFSSRPKCQTVWKRTITLIAQDYSGRQYCAKCLSAVIRQAVIITSACDAQSESWLVGSVISNGAYVSLCILYVNLDIKKIVGFHNLW